VALLGQSGAVAILILVFLAVTSASSAELIAVSSILTYDVYRSYINPAATGPEIIRTQHYCTIGFGIFMGVLASVLNVCGITLGYLYLLMGIIIASAVIPIALTLCWSKQNATAVVVAPAVGFVCGLTTWLVVAKSLYGEVTVASTGMNMPMLSGNLVSLLLPFFITVPWSLMYPQNYDFETTRKISVLEDEKDDCELEYNLEEEEDPEALNKALKFAYSCAWVLTFILIFLWPLPMLGEKYVFTWQFFTLWVSVGFIWALIASAVCIFYPIIEAKDGIMIICKGIVEDAKGDLSSQPICVIMYTYVYIHINVHTYIYTKNL
jgi:hypothetical protein